LPFPKHQLGLLVWLAGIQNTNIPVVSNPQLFERLQGPGYKYRSLPHVTKGTDSASLLVLLWEKNSANFVQIYSFHQKETPHMISESK